MLVDYKKAGEKEIAIGRLVILIDRLEKEKKKAELNLSRAIKSRPRETRLQVCAEVDGDL